MSIGRKLTFWILLVVFITGMLSAYFFFRMHIASETARLESLGNITGRIVERSLDNYMMVRDFSVLDKTLHDLRDVRSISSISLINREGVIKISTDKMSVGVRLERGGPGCRGCHETMKQGLYLGEMRTFRWVQPIKNKPECFTCHSPSIRNNGIFVIDFSLSALDREVKNEAVVGFLILVPSLLLIGLVMLYLTKTLVISRLTEVTDKVKKFREGDYDARIILERKDEVTKLEQGFNEMAETINMRERELRRNYDLQSVINGILQLSLESTPLEEILDKALNLILSIPWLTIESMGSIFLVEGDPETLVMKAQKGLSPQILEECGALPLGKCMCGMAALRQEVEFSDTLDERHEVRYEGIEPHGHYCVPILLSGKTVGVISMYLSEGHKRDDMEEQFLNAIANALAGIIQRKRVEGEREKLIKDLEITLAKVSRSQKTWQETFDSIGDMISIHDEDGNIIKVNRAFAENFHLDPKEVIHRKCHDFFHAGRGPIPDCPHAQTLRENRPARGEIIDVATGRIFMVSTFPFHIHDAQLHGSIHVAKDITEERDKEMRLITSERLASLGQMASGIAHEINNPLAAIAGCAEGLLLRVEKDKYDPELFRSYLKIIEEEILRCKSITTSMLSFVRKTTYEKKVLNVNEVVEKAIEIIGFQGRLVNISVVSRSVNGIPPIRGSEGELRQVFLAIITNALDAMNNTGTLTIETGVEKGSVYVKIADTGPGIRKEDVARIFDPFFTTKSETGGTGLGLSIANRIISNHNGSIDVSTGEGMGTVFKITLPTAQSGS